MILDNRTRYRSADLERIILLALAEAGITNHGRDRVVVVYGGLSGCCYKGRITRWNGHARMRLRLPDPTHPRRDYERGLANQLADARGVCHTFRCRDAMTAGVDLGPVGPRPGDWSAEKPWYQPGSRRLQCTDCGAIWISVPQADGPPRPPPPDPHPLDVPEFAWLVRHEVGHWRGLDHGQMHPTLRDWKPWIAAGRPLPAWAAGLTVAVDDAPPARPGKPRPTADDAREKKLAHARGMLATAERRRKLAETVEKRWRRRLAAAERAVAQAAARGRP